MAAPTMRLLAFLLPCTLVLAACSSVPLGPAPVVNRGFTPAGQIPSPGVSTGGPNAAFAGQPGYYTVKPGDTLRRIAAQTGQSWHDLVRWNQLANPNVIEVGQVLRVAPPVGSAPASAAAPGASGAVAQAVPLEAAGGASAAAPSHPASAPAHRAASHASSPARPPSAASSGASVHTPAASALPSSGPLHWQWPVAGKVLQGYNGASSKGLDIAGRLGETVRAAAAGRVVYAGNELRGFGNLVIVKHNADYISVYAHNDRLLVKDGETVSAGQPVALMGSSDAPRVELHFEVRLRGKPIDPMQVLPAR
ncbi:murein hydrolase activator NlpD precursor [mine drainage metagenome]|uniref:Murein hydrolase activator NlpD n=1 Tax=mine drainage metagenome TaxID=410659 RepID=A0A1J5R129_9ZZZZ